MAISVCAGGVTLCYVESVFYLWRTHNREHGHVAIHLSSGVRTRMIRRSILYALPLWCSYTRDFASVKKKNKKEKQMEKKKVVSRSRGHASLSVRPSFTVDVPQRLRISSRAQRICVSDTHTCLCGDSA